MILYCESKGKKYENYKSFLLSAISKDFGKKPERHKTKPVKKEKELTPEEKIRIKSQIDKIKNNMTT